MFDLNEQAIRSSAADALVFRVGGAMGAFTKSMSTYDMKLGDARP